jgi:xanthine/uracil/vitamin C permease (AzgA family)
VGAWPVVAMLAAFAASVYLLVVQGRILGDAIDRPLFPCLVLVLLGELLVVMAMGAIGLGGAAPAPS